MKVIAHISLGDEDRNHLAQLWDQKESKRMVSRDEIRQFVADCIERELQKNEPTPEDHNDRGAGTNAPSDDGPARDRELPQGNSGRPEFVSSRGDEPYIHQPKDPELAAACRAVFDNLAVIEDKAWQAFYADSKFRRETDEETLDHS